MARLVFMGSPAFALPSLVALMEAGHEIVLVLSRPDQPAGRGRGLQATAVGDFARESGLPLETPEKLRDPALHDRLAMLEADLFVVVAYRILPASLLALPRLGAINLHGSLLPAYRGAAPIERALMDGVSRTGLSTFILEKGVDTGKILDQAILEVGEDETAGELKHRMMTAGAALLADSVQAVLEGRHHPRMQPEGTFPPAPKLDASTRDLDLRRGAGDLHNHIRALSPEPGALALFRGKPMQVLRSRIPREMADTGLPLVPGSLMRVGARLLARCGDGILEILELAPAGRKRMPAAAWVSGARLQPGERLESSLLR